MHKHNVAQHRSPIFPWGWHRKEHKHGNGREKSGRKMEKLGKIFSFLLLTSLQNDHFKGTLWHHSEKYMQLKEGVGSV